MRIAGVFSPYLWAFELLDKPVKHHQDREIQFLGETTLEKQEALKREFNDDDLVVAFFRADVLRANIFFPRGYSTIPNIFTRNEMKLERN